MTDGVRERVKDLLDQAARLPPEQRRRFIHDAADVDPVVRHEALELLAELDSGGFLAAPTVSQTTEPVAAPPTDERAGAIIGRYKLLQLIGEGGFGAVFLAEQSEPVHRRVALKVIKAGMDTRQVIARFDAERQALALMDHPNIARVLDGGATQSGRPYFVMELVRGEPVTTYCDRAHLSVRERLNLFLEICSAVQHAHQKGVIHRDIKPSNVLVTVSGGRPRPMVIDFGIAKATAGRLTDRTLFTELHQWIGTPQYMSPEQADVLSADVDTRSDVYSLGVLLYELLAGSTPLETPRLRGLSLAEIQRLIREEEPPRPSLRLATLASSSARFATSPSPGASPAAGDSSAADIAVKRQTDPLALTRAVRGDLDWIVMKCLEKERSRRYESASALAADVARFLANQPIHARPPTLHYRLSKFVRRNRTLVAAGALLGLVLLGGVVGTTWGMVWALRERARAADEARNARFAADETRQVAEFQSQMLAGIDVEAMGRGLRERYREQVRAALERQQVGDGSQRRPRPAEEIDAALATFDRIAADVHGVDVARRVLDEFVLRRAADALEPRFADQPLVQAQIRAAIGTTYRTLGLYTEAEPHLRAALELRRRELGESHERVAESRLALCALLHEQGRFADAETACRQALESFQALPGHDIETASALNSLGELLRSRGDYAAALPYCADALALRRKALGDAHEEVATSLNNLALLLVARADYAAAESRFREAIEINRNALGDAHPNVAAGLVNLAGLLQDTGNLAAAEPLLREGLARLRARFGDEHRDVAVAMGNLARLLAAKGESAEAETLHRQALALHRGRLGDAHPDVAATLDSLASIYWSRGDYDAAEPFRREALALRREALGPDHPDVANTLNNLAALLRSKGDGEAAEPLYREAIEIFRRSRGHDHPQVAAGLNNLGVLLQDRGDYAAAEPLFREAVEICVARLPPTHLNIAFTRAGLATSLIQLGRLDEAEANVLSAFEIVEANPAAPPHLRVRVYKNYVELFEARHAAEPTQGFDRQAAEWRDRLRAFEASTQPASRWPPTGSPAAFDLPALPGTFASLAPSVESALALSAYS